MRFSDFQSGCANIGAAGSRSHLLLGLGAHAGELMRNHRLYLDGLDAEANRTTVLREVGDLLVDVSDLVTSAGLSLGVVAQANVAKIRERAAMRALDASPDLPGNDPELREYQTLAATTDENAGDGSDPLSLGVPVLGLAGEVGTLLVAQKKAVRDLSPQADDPAFLSVELGDVLWYASTVTTHYRLDLEDVAAAALNRARERAHDRAALSRPPSGLPQLDEDCRPDERLPRQLVVRFREAQVRGRDRAVLTLISATPNQFPEGPVERGEGKTQGFAVGGQLGDPLTDNSRRMDGYRYHDAIHLGFMAVMGWSPVSRQLLGLKRRSDPDRDENEDGARAVFAEEGVAAVLAKRSEGRQRFMTEDAVDDASLEIVTTVFEDLEVREMPTWLWRRAVCQGFVAMRELERGPGGFLALDLDARSLRYTRTAP